MKEVSVLDILLTPYTGRIYTQRKMEKRRGALSQNDLDSPRSTIERLDGDDESQLNSMAQEEERFNENYRRFATNKAIGQTMIPFAATAI